MTQISVSENQNRAAPLSRELNDDIGYVDGSRASVEEVISTYTDRPPEEQRGRPVLSSQVPPRIAEGLLTSLPVTLLYQYRRDTEVTTAWRFNDTTKALIRCDDSARDRGEWYMLPPVGEAQLDLRWMALHSVYREIPFTISYLAEDTLRSLLQMTRPKDRAGVEQLLTRHRETQ